jgi:hypothetical protein
MNIRRGSKTESREDGGQQRIIPEPLARRRASRLRPEMRLRELLDAWSRARSPAPKTLDGASRAIEQFIDLFGDIAASEIVADDLFDYRDMVAVLPRRLSTGERAQGFAKLVAHYSEASDPGPRVALSTVIKQLRYVQNLLVFAFRERWIADNVGRHIPAIGYTGRHKRRAFTRDEVRAVFALPIFVNAWSLPSSDRSATRRSAG